jgi:hypothetical protein
MQKFRLFQIGDINENGKFDLLPFDEPFDKAFDYEDGNIEAFDALDDLLDNLVRHLFPEGGTYYPIDNDRHADDLVAFDGNGNIRILTANGDIAATIPNLIGRIAVDPDEAVFFVLFDRTYTEFCWAVVAQQDADDRVET